MSVSRSRLGARLVLAALVSILFLTLNAPGATYAETAPGSATAEKAWNVLDSVAPVLHAPPDLSRIPAVEGPERRTPPSGLEVVNPAEFCAMDALLIAWAGWETQLAVDVIRAVSDDYRVLVLVRNAATERTVRGYLQGQGINIANVGFIIDDRISGGSMWIRDYGPFCEYGDGTRGIVDFRYGSNPSDDWINQTIADSCGLPFFHTDLLHHGGNHTTDGNGMGFLSTNIIENNPSWSLASIRQEFRDYLGVDSLVVFEPMQGDLTGHCDMFCKLLNDTLFVVGEYAHPEDSYPGDYDLLNNLAAMLGSLHNLDGRPFTVARLPMCQIENGGPAGRINRTYTNMQIFNDKALLPIYDRAEDAIALERMAELMPGYEIIGINSSTIITYAGAIHCMVNTLSAPDPLIVLHTPLTEIPIGAEPRISFTLNPRFADTEASVWYRPDSAPDFIEAPAALAGGRWTVRLPAMTEDFSYYIAGTATSGSTVMEVNLPAGAPGSVFSVDVMDPASVTDAATLALLRAGPNPFMGATRLWYAVPSAMSGAAVRLTIHDAGGRLVRTLVDRIQAPGAYAEAWDATDRFGRRLPAGTYFVRLDVGGSSRTSRIVLAR
jgi:agmatine/peptidylarginine deiminase